MGESKGEKNKFKFLIAIAAVVTLIIASLNLIFNVPPDSNIALRKIIGIASLIFWLGLLIWSLYRFFKR